MLSKPAQAARSNLEGITLVVTKMDWYCTLTDHLLDKSDETLGATLEKLEEKVLELYKAILLYQMQSVCYYHQNQVKAFGRAILGKDDWDGMRKAVEDAEDDLMKYWCQYNNVRARQLQTDLKEITKKMAEDLGTIRQSLGDLIDQQRNDQKDADLSKCLADLFVVPPQDHMETIKKGKGGLIDDVYKWILDDKKYAAFTNWDKSNLAPHRLLWIKGPAGTGKTMLLIGIIRELLDQSGALASKLSYFFCQSTDANVNDATKCIRTLIWMMIIQQPDLFKHLRQQHKSSGASLFEGKYALATLSRVLKDMLKGARPTYLIVDALDECDQGLDELIQVISDSLAQPSQVRWLVSSRPELVEELKKKHPDTAGTLDELDVLSQRDRLDKYIDYKLHALKNSNQGYADGILETVDKKVRAEDNFLWLHLVFKDLEEIGPHAVETIGDYPSGLENLYEHKMTRIVEGNAERRQHCMDVLLGTSLAYRPLSLSELAVLVPWSAMAPPKKKVEIIRVVQKECASFLTQTKETVNLVHKSAKEYLVHYLEEHQSDLGGGAAQKHADIVRRSIDAMSKTLKTDVYDLGHWDISSKDIKPPGQDPLAPIQYACVFWLDHLCDAIMSPENRKELCNNVFDFLKKHFLHWIESLSLLQSLSKGIVSIRKLLNVIQVCLSHWIISTILRSNSRIPKRAPSLPAS